jgi:hypothetical protein
MITIANNDNVRNVNHGLHLPAHMSDQLLENRGMIWARKQETSLGSATGRGGRSQCNPPLMAERAGANFRRLSQIAVGPGSPT